MCVLRIGEAKRSEEDAGLHTEFIACPSNNHLVEFRLSNFAGMTVHMEDCTDVQLPTNHRPLERRKKLRAAER